MSGIEFNKILAAIIITIIIFVIIGIIGNLVVNIDYEEQETAYKIDIPENTTQSAVQTSSNNEEIESISPLLINASLEKGEKIFITLHLRKYSKPDISYLK